MKPVVRFERAAILLAAACLACASVPGGDGGEGVPERSVADLRDCGYTRLEPVEEIRASANEARKAVRMRAKHAGGDAVINVQIERAGSAQPDVGPEVGPVKLGRPAPAGLMRGRGTPVKYVSGDCSKK